MKFRKDKEDTPCKSCGMGLTHQQPTGTPEDAMKQLKEMEKSKVQSMPCPYLKDCDFKMLPEIGKLLCMDFEDGSRQDQAYMVHMAKHHMWEQCRKFNDRKREVDGVLPKDLPDLLKGKKR